MIVVTGGTNRAEDRHADLPVQILIG